MCLFQPISHYLNYYSFIMRFKIRLFDSFKHILFQEYFSDFSYFAFKNMFKFWLVYIFKSPTEGAGEMGWLLIIIAALVKDLDSVLAPT